MDIKEEFKEQVCRDIADNIDKYGRGWNEATNTWRDFKESLDYFCDIDMITIEQEKSLLDAFYKFIHAIDKVFDEIK